MYSLKSCFLVVSLLLCPIAAMAQDGSALWRAAHQQRPRQPQKKHRGRDRILVPDAMAHKSVSAVKQPGGKLCARARSRSPQRSSTSTANSQRYIFS